METLKEKALFYLNKDEKKCIFNLTKFEEKLIKEFENNIKSFGNHQKFKFYFRSFLLS